jgi:hypothetical protein
VVSGRPTVRKVQLPSGRRMTQEAKAGGRKAAGNRDDAASSSAGGLAELAGYELMLGPERALTWVR